MTKNKKEGQVHVNSLSKSQLNKSKRWQKLQSKEYRDAYAESKLSIEIPFQIRALRKARGWTQAQLAARCRIPQARISHIEQPGRDPLSLRTLYRLSSAFDVGLLVDFVSFSELVNREAAFNPEVFNVASFEDDHLWMKAEDTNVAYVQLKKTVVTCDANIQLKEAVASSNVYARLMEALVASSEYDQPTELAQSIKTPSAETVFLNKVSDKLTILTRPQDKTKTRMYLDGTKIPAWVMTKSKRPNSCDFSSFLRNKNLFATKEEPTCLQNAPGKVNQQASI